MPLNDKQARFVAEYLKDLNATRAAIRAGYSKATANRIGSRLLSKVDIAAAIAEGSRKALETAEATAARTIEEWRRLAYSDVTNVITGDEMTLADLKNLPPDVRACIASVEIVKRNVTTGDKQLDTVLKLKFWDKPKALEALSKYFGLDVQRVEHSGGIDIRWQGDE